ncbi:MAG: hypothetical protein KDC69_11435, partial [Flavobacteriaceae bacterium]|nr:hypothetical protein [Flavobacteriaceae bacterium]
MMGKINVGSNASIQKDMSYHVNLFSNIMIRTTKNTEPVKKNFFRIALPLAGIFFLVCGYSQEQNSDYTFIGEIRFAHSDVDFVPSFHKRDVPYASFKACYELQLYIKDGQKYRKEVPKLILAKETYYEKDEQPHKIEIRINLEQEDFRKQKKITLQGVFTPINKDVSRGWLSKELLLEIPNPGNDTSWINSST